MKTCFICNKEFKNGGVLARHLILDHEISYREYHHKYVLCTDEIPKCKCGCGEELNWTYVGYRKYKPSHHIRVKNPWGHNPKALQKSIETRRRRFKEGKIKIWNKGLTKDNDDRVKMNILASTVSINSNPEELLRRSNLMKQQRKDGTIVDLKGSRHSQWKGGTSEINVLVRSRSRLYKEWKYPILIRDGFKCIECGKDKDLQVHHDKEQVHEIIKKHIVDGIDPKTFEEKEFIADAVVDYHIKNKVSGVTLCRECHGKIHPSLNFK